MGRCMEKVSAKIENEDSTDLQEEEEEKEQEDQPYMCGICLDDDIRAFDVVVKPCKCATSYCKKCWNRSMCAAPRCPTCRRSIGFDYDSENGEAKFLLYEDPESVRGGMIVLPEGYKPGTQIEGRERNYLSDEMSQRVRPTFLKMLAENSTGEEGARTCVCGGKNCFRRMTMEERRGYAQNPCAFEPVCDACDTRQYEVGEMVTLVWTTKGIPFSLEHISGRVNESLWRIFAASMSVRIVCREMPLGSQKMSLTHGRCPHGF